MPDSFGRHLRRITRELAHRLTSILRKISARDIELNQASRHACASRCFTAFSLTGFTRDFVRAYNELANQAMPCQGALCGNSTLSPGCRPSEKISSAPM